MLAQLIRRETVGREGKVVLTFEIEGEVLVDEAIVPVGSVIWLEESGARMERVSTKQAPLPPGLLRS